MTQEPITNFNGPYRFLSNFAYCTVVFEGHDYPTVEHAYQAAKTTNEKERKHIRELYTPSAAKQYGNGLILRDEWKDESFRISIMRGLLEQKFKKPHFRAQLLETDDRELIEGNYWFDDFWGVCTANGQNHLGKLLMEIRAELRYQ